MRKFEFNSVGRIFFGPGQFARLSELAATMGRTALVVHNGPDAGDKASEALLAAGMTVRSHRQSGEPVVEQIDAAVETARRAGCDCVIGVGGGSAIDAAKAVAGLLTNGGSTLDYMEVVGAGRKLTRPALPWIAMPTTAGSGAEATRNAVIGYPPKQFKASLRSELLLAKAVIVDPELHLGIPADVTARSGMDALCQCIESFVSVGANVMTRPLSLEGIRLAGKALPRAVEYPEDLLARGDMAAAALLSGICLSNAGLGAVHGFAAPLGAYHPIPHGTICAALLAPVIAANIAALRDAGDPDERLSGYAAVGRVLADDPALSPSDAIDACAPLCADLSRRLRIPALRQFGMTERDIEPMVQLAMKSSSIRYNPVPLDERRLFDILRAGIDGE